MKSDDVARLEAAVRSANPVLQPADLVGSEESAAVMLLVREGRDPMTSTHAPQQLRSSGTDWRRAWAFATTFVLVLVGVAAATLLLRGGGPVADQPQDTVQMGPITWTKVDTGDTWIDWVVPLGDGFVAMQFHGDGSDDGAGEFVTSPDGITWTPIDGSPLADGEMFNWYDGGPWGAAGSVVGTVEGQPGAQLVFFRLDGTWVRSDPAAEVGAPLGPFGETFDAIAVSEHGVLIPYSEFGQFPEGEFGEIVFLTSPDGERWEIIDAPEGLFNVYGLTGTSFGPLLTGEAQVGDQPSFGMQNWLAADGRTWEEVIVTEEHLGGVDQLPEAWGGGIAYLNGPYDPDTGTARTAIFQTANGTDWTEMDMTAFGSEPPYAIRGGGIGLLGFNDRETMFTADGTEWVTADVADLFGYGSIDWGRLAGGTDRFVGPFAPFDETDKPDLWVGTIEGVEVPEEWPPATVVTLPPETTTPSPSTTVAAKPLADADLTTVAENLWFFMPTREDRAAISGLESHSIFWWDTISPWFVGMDEWWTGAGWGAGFVSKRGIETPDPTFQFGVFETPAQAQAALDSIAVQPRFTDPSRVVAAIELPPSIDGFGVALDRMADEAFVIEPEAVAADPEYTPFDGVDQTQFVAQRFDRVVAVIAMHGSDELGTETIVELASVVEDRAGRFGEIVADPPPKPSRDAQPLPWIIFSGAPPTLAELEIPASYELDGWSVEPCRWAMAIDRCLEVRLDGREVRTFDLNSEIPWGGFGRGLGPYEALETWITEDMWNDDGTVTDFRHFTVGGAPAVRHFTTREYEDGTIDAAIEVYILKGNPMTTFRLLSWDEIGDGIDPELIRAAVPIIDQLLLGAEAAP